MTDEKSILQEAARLAKRECANYDDGYCFMDDQFRRAVMPGHTIHDGAIDCTYFLDAVLPLDKELHEAIVNRLHHDEYAPWINLDGTEPQEFALKQCSSCGKYFTPKSNRQRYCASCAVEAERKRNAKSHRVQYWSGRT